MRHLDVFVALVLMLFFDSRLGNAVGYYTPPYNAEAENKGEALKKFNKYLEMEGKPPFEEEEKKK